MPSVDMFNNSHNYYKNYCFAFVHDEPSRVGRGVRVFGCAQQSVCCRFLLHVCACCQSRGLRQDLHSERYRMEFHLFLNKIWLPRGFVSMWRLLSVNHWIEGVSCLHGRNGANEEVIMTMWWHLSALFGSIPEKKHLTDRNWTQRMCCCWLYFCILFWGLSYNR